MIVTSKVEIINNALFWVTGILALYILVTPAVPLLTFYFQDYLHPGKVFDYQQELETTTIVKDESGNEVATAPVGNSLIVASIGVAGQVFEATSSDILQKGIWHRPRSSTPEQGSNTVLVAHRFLYTAGPSTFYNLDKVKVGETFSLWWDGKKYDYEVYENIVVPATALEIEQPTKEPIVTLYTCTPLWTAKDRLVVRGKLIKTP